MGAIINKYCRIGIIGIIFFACFLLKSSALAQDKLNDSLIISMLSSFYKQYITMIAEEEPRFYKQKMDSLLKEHCSKTFLDYLKNCELDYDPFLKAQDSDIEYLKTLKVLRNPNKKNEYIVRYRSDGLPGKKIVITIYVSIIKEEGKCKINMLR